MMPTSELRQLKLRQVKPLAKVSQQRVHQPLVWFGPWPGRMTLNQCFSLSEPQFLYHWRDHGLNAQQSGACKVLGTGLVHTVSAQ